MCGLIVTVVVRHVRACQSVDRLLSQRVESAKQEVATSSLASIPGRTEGLVKEATSSPAKKKVCVGVCGCVVTFVYCRDGGFVRCRPQRSRKESILTNTSLTNWRYVRRVLYDLNTPYPCTQDLVSVYQNSGDKWRALQTNKAIQSIKRQTTEITSYEVTN